MSASLSNLLLACGTLLAILLIWALVTRARGKKLPPSLPRLLLIALATAVLVTAVIVAIFLVSFTEPMPAWFPFALVVICLGVAALFVAFVLFLGAFYSLSRWGLTSLRANLTVALGAAAMMMLGSWYLLLKDPAGFVESYVAGFLLGLGAGLLWVRSIKKMISGDTIDASRYFRRKLSFKVSLAYWKETVLFVLAAGIGFLTLKFALQRNLDIILALFPGFFSGMTLLGFVWVHQHEKRNGVRIKFQYYGPGKADNTPGV